ncbi:hypothetical protein [Paenibacillus sp. J2TS4]|nr:hypothetical protein [Paenibacillus sp. J2TS4]
MKRRSFMEMADLVRFACCFFTNSQQFVLHRTVDFPERQGYDKVSFGWKA